MEVDGVAEAGSETSKKLRLALSDIVDTLDLFGDLTEELSKGRECKEVQVQDVCRTCIEKIKAIRSGLRSVFPNHAAVGAGASYDTSNTTLDSYLENAQADASLEKLKLCRSLLESMRNAIDG
ncbi:hypothetical protein HOP50_11g62580 [Chloropicon primus]|uniref:Uncharacterized protein n=1 Tax=Chloropicon primus TaxID=1764295 RepID=A0A5B8MSI1_9CHLO|nr:hypothetical protein A3770_11p62360 [Chloropicon primus]UPR02931.1 hypothetical protein HOP50_11g62580 [Chloropicon primus]|eukprot:QDZ23718.1 hypothetical protein A3770_11p62360 [Chloropicon primus]